MTTPTGSGYGGYGADRPGTGGPSGAGHGGSSGTPSGADRDAGHSREGVPVSGAPQVDEPRATDAAGSLPPEPAPTPVMPPAGGTARAATDEPEPRAAQAAPPREGQGTAASAPRHPAGPPPGTATIGSLPGGATPLRSGKPRRARLVVRRIDPWSVLKFTLLFSLCLLIVFVVAVAALYYALDSMGVFTEVNDFVRELTQASSGGQRTGGVEVPFTASRVIGVAAVIGLINVVLVTAISTLGAFLYNLCADIVGGIEVTLAERD